MSDNINPEDKPSFFDSGEESKSWPPADNYEIENEPLNKVDDSSSQSFFDADDFENPFQEDQNKAPEETPAETTDSLDEYIIEDEASSNEETSIIPENTEDFLDSDDYLDQLIDNVDEKSNINNMRIIDDEIDTNDFKINDTLTEPDPISEEELILNKEETNASYEEDLNQSIDIDNLVNENELQEPVIDDTEEVEDKDDDFDLDDLLEDDFSSETSKESRPNLDIDSNDFLDESHDTKTEDEDPFADSLLATGIGAAGLAASNMAFSDPEGITSNFDNNANQESNNFTDQDYQAQTSFDEDYAESEFVDFVDDDSSGLKPFRTFTKINLAEELADEKDEEEAGGVFAGINRNVLIILAIVLLSLFYFLFNMFFNKEVVTRSRERKRPPKKERSFSRTEQVLTPVWEVSSQKTKNPDLEDKYAKSLIKFTGRENPFAMPQSVIDALKRQADMALLAKVKPNTFKRMAYRATLLGVLTSEGSTIALVNMQEATFDVIEGTTQTKVLKLATKSMDKAKKNTLEMAKGSFIGPWEIVSVATPKGAFSDAKITVEFQGTQKVLSMGKAEDLGIFDPAGQLDNLESTENEFEDDDFDDDF